MKSDPITVPEPVLPMDEIQGIAVPGFLKPHQTLLGIVCGEQEPAIQTFKQILRELASQIATAAQTLKDRRRHRKQTAKTAHEPHPPLLAIGFTARGLSKLTPGASAIPSPAFQQGLAARSSYLGDPHDPDNSHYEGNPENWKIGGPKNEADALIIIAGDTRESVDQRVEELELRIEHAALQIIYREAGDVRPDLVGHEHFGFDDGVSQPGIRGRASTAKHDFITDRQIADKQEPEHSLFGYPGQDLVWPGVLILGHPATSPDPLVPGIPSPATPDWTRNGSFLVFRRLRQDVGLFWRTLQKEAARLSPLPGFAGMTDEKLASRLVGRWPSGARSIEFRQRTIKNSARISNANNYFRFDSDAHALPLASGTDPFPQSKADPAGITCPWAAHIRKVNTPRFRFGYGGTRFHLCPTIAACRRAFRTAARGPLRGIARRSATGRSRIAVSQHPGVHRGPVRIPDGAWMGDPSRPKMPGGYDMLVGQNNTPGENRQRSCLIFGEGVQQAMVSTDAQWIVPTGGGYFFIPSISALKGVVAR